MRFGPWMNRETTQTNRKSATSDLGTIGQWKVVKGEGRMGARQEYCNSVK